MISIAFSNFSLGNLSIIISILALVYTFYKDRQLRKKEYADKIRNSSGKIISKLDRWKELLLHFFDDIQPIITEIDGFLVQKGDVTEARDRLWIGLHRARAKTFQRIMNEQIEMAYADLHGYDPRIQELFTKTVEKMKSIDIELNKNFLYVSQREVLRLKERKRPLKSGQLGNQLRTISDIYLQQYRIEMNKVIIPFSLEMMKLIKLTDDKIVDRDIEIPDISKIFNPIADLSRESLEGIIAEADHHDYMPFYPGSPANRNQ
jgi:hypothetical protein